MNANITKETIELAKKALESPLAKDASTQGYLPTLGLYGYPLEAPAKSLFPVLSPFRNTTPRVKQQGSGTAAHWKAITAINSANVRATAAFTYAGNRVTTNERDFMANYKEIALMDSVAYDAQILAEGFQDLRATSGVNLLYALMMQEEKILLGGQNFSLGTVSAPNVTVSSTTAGSISAASVDVAVKARTLQGYYDGQGTAVSGVGTVGSMTGSTNQVKATVTAVPGAFCYDWYIGSHGGTLYYAFSTTINVATFSTVPVSGATTSGVPMCAIPAYSNNGVMTAIPTSASTGAATDCSADTNAFNGLAATLTGDYSGGVFVTNGTGTSNGAYIRSLDGAALTGSSGTIAEIDTALQYLWQNARVSPSKILCNSVDHVNISNKIIASGGAYTLFRPGDVAERQAVVGGQLVETYINKAVMGRPIALETLPDLPQGTLMIVTEQLPYPNSKVANVMEVETKLEYTQYDYAASAQSGQANGGPRYDFQVMALETFKNYFPGSMAIISNIANG